MIFDLHISTALSGNSLVAPEELIDHALDLGLDGICVTEHNNYEASAVCVEFAKGLPLVVLRGIELSTNLGELLVYGISENETKFIEQRKLSAFEIADYVDTRGGICIPAHPFDNGRHSIGEALLSLPNIKILEGYNGRTSDFYNQMACEFATNNGLSIIGGSNAITIEQVGTGITEFYGKVHDETSLIQELKAGNFIAKYGYISEYFI